jgi:hypothetical protein
VDQGPREGTERMGPDGPVRAATLSVVVRLWSEDGTGLMLRGEVEHVHTSLPLGIIHRHVLVFRRPRYAIPQRLCG